MKSKRITLLLIILFHSILAAGTQTETKMMTSEFFPSATDPWTQAQGKTAKGKHTLIRYRPNCAKIIGNDDYSTLLTITWEYESREDGMPAGYLSSVLDRLKEFEETIISALEVDNYAIVTFITTFDGERKWHFYIQDREKLSDIVNRALQDTPVLPIRFEVETDTEWEEFRSQLIVWGAKELIPNKSSEDNSE